MCSCSLKDFLSFIEGTIYDDPAALIQKKTLWRMLKESPQAIGADEVELEKKRAADRAAQMPKRRLGELEYIDEFVNQIEIQKEGFSERTLSMIREMQKTPYEHRQERLAKERAEKEAQEANEDKQLN
jgi:hypothetical protein